MNKPVSTPARRGAMTSPEGVRRQFVSDGHSICSKCDRGIPAGEMVDSSPPSPDGRLRWRDNRCYPSCEEVDARRVAGRSPPHPPPAPALRIFDNEFDGVVCCSCNSFIEVGDKMAAVVGPGLPRWQQKKHHPSCPPGGTPAATLGGRIDE